MGKWICSNDNSEQDTDEKCKICGLEFNDFVKDVIMRGFDD